MSLIKLAMLAMLAWFACVSFAQDDDDFNTEPDPAPISQPATNPATVDQADTDGFKDEVKQAEGAEKPKVPEPEKSKRPSLASPAHHDHAAAKATHKASKSGKAKTAKEKAAKKKKDALKAKKKKKTDDDAP